MKVNMAGWGGGVSANVSMWMLRSSCSWNPVGSQAYRPLQDSCSWMPKRKVHLVLTSAEEAEFLRDRVVPSLHVSPGLTPHCPIAHAAVLCFPGDVGLYLDLSFDLCIWKS